MSSLWMMDYAYPQLISNLTAISVTVLHLPSWTRALTCATLSAIHEVVRWLKQSSLMMPVLPLWNLSTHWYTFLCITQFSLIVLTFICESWSILPPLTTKIKGQYVDQQWCKQSHYIYTM